jgi:hypothetical protein
MIPNLSENWCLIGKKVGIIALNRMNQFSSSFVDCLGDMIDPADCMFGVLLA